MIKPDIVFFGESLPERFFKCIKKDFKKCDLLIIMGTSLVVHPFAGLIHMVGKKCPRLLINLEICDSFDIVTDDRNLFWEGTCDDGCQNLESLLGWDEHNQDKDPSKEE